MIDLSGTSGLPLTLNDEDPQLALRLPGNLQPGELRVRPLTELRETLEDPEATGPAAAYYMYNGAAVFSATDGQRWFNWRYDLTVLPAGRCGEEYLRTAGHYHPLIEGRGVAWPEVYEVLYGSALFILQRSDDHEAGPDKTRVQDAILLRAEAGQKAMLPPGYGHWTVNVTPGPLVISNWISADFESHHASVAQARGPCCYVKAGKDGPRYERNRTYAHPPAHLRHARPAEVPELGLQTGKPMFRELHRRPDLWQYVCDPALAPVDLHSAIEIIRTEPFPR